MHDDAAAAAQAAAVDAAAFTLGNHIIFGEGQSATSTYDGRRLLAHELAHTIQQAGQAGPVIQRQRRGQRGPRVQVRSPVFEETVTQLTDIAGGAVGRPLLPDEIALAEPVFGTSIDYSRVRLVPVDVLQFRTIANNIYIPNDFSITDAYHAQTLIHELTHVWQYQHTGTSYISVSLVSQIGAALRGSRNLAYDYTLAPDSSFFDFGPEQQGLIVENYFAMLRDQQEITAATAPATTAATGATGAPAPAKHYVSNHMDASGSFQWISAADRLAEIQRELPLHQPLLAQVRASMPQPELDLLQLRALDGIDTRQQDMFQVPPERQVTPLRPLIQIRF